jgi:multiple sugar transport system permease protein
MKHGATRRPLRVAIAWTAIPIARAWPIGVGQSIAHRFIAHRFISHRFISHWAAACKATAHASQPDDHNRMTRRRDHPTEDIMADGISVPAGVLVGTAPATRRSGSLRRLSQRRSTIGLLMCLPLILMVATLVAYPAFYAIYLSMLNKKMTSFVGLGNFAFLLQRNTFQMVIFQSCLFAVTAVVFKALLGFIIAHLMHNVPGKNQRIWRGLLLVPWVIPLALSTLGWWWMFDPSYSAFNWVLNQFGIASVPWLGVGWIARFCTITVNVWYGTPFFMIMYLAALKSVPEQLYEAAAIDGASTMQKLFFVTLPMVRNIIAITVLFSLIVTFADFDIVRILTGGGPQDMTHIFATYAFQVGIQSGDIPLGASVSLFMFPILAVAAFFVLRGVTRRTKEIAA